MVLEGTLCHTRCPCRRKDFQISQDPSAPPALIPLNGRTISEPITFPLDPIRNNLKPIEKNFLSYWKSVAALGSWKARNQREPTSSRLEATQADPHRPVARIPLGSRDELVLVNPGVNFSCGPFPVQLHGESMVSLMVAERGFSEAASHELDQTGGHPPLPLRWI